LAVRAQQADRVRRIGVLSSGNASGSAFTQALAGLGWTVGRNVQLDLRSAGGDINRARPLAQEQPDIILTDGTLATVVVQQETRTIPIVFASAADPVVQRIVLRADRPGGNITGFASFEATLGGKWLELLSEIAPGLKRAAIMFNPDLPPALAYMPSFETAAQSLKVAPITVPVRSDLEIETAIIALGCEPGGGLVLLPDVFLTVHRASIILAAARNNVPAVYYHNVFARGGGEILKFIGDGLLTLLRRRPGRHRSSRRHLCRSHSTRREAGGPTRSVRDQIRTDHQPQDRQGPRPHHPGNAAGDR
jgi:putative ABC transport system substrate-binding protein